MRSFAHADAAPQRRDGTLSPTSAEQRELAQEDIRLDDYALDREYRTSERRTFGFFESGSLRAGDAPYPSLATRPSQAEELVEADFPLHRGEGELDKLVTLREGVFRRDLLRWDTERYFSDIATGGIATAAHNVPQPSDGALGNDADSHERSLASLLQHTRGLIIGRDRRQRYAAKTLERALPALVESGLKTLFLSEIPRDLFQASLDRHFASQSPHLPTSVATFLGTRPPHRLQRGLGYASLIQTAHRLGVRVRALNSAASFRESHGGVPLFLKMPIYEAKHVIDAYMTAMAQTPDDKWIALTDVEHLSGAFGIPGLAALTGATSLRVTPGETSGITPDPGRVAEHDNRPQPYLWEWLQADYLMTDPDAPTERSRKGRATAQPGDDAVQAQDIDTYSLDPVHHALVREDITKSGSAYALRAVKELTEYGERPSNDARGRAIVDLVAKRTQLRNDASRHFSAMYQGRGSFPASANPALEDLRHGHAVTVGDLLRSPASGIAFGESHGTDEPLAFLTRNMARFKQLGVKTFFFEHVARDIFQDDLDAHFRKPETDLSPALQGFLHRLHTGHDPFGRAKHSYLELVLAAHRAGLRVVAIDNVASYCDAGLPDHARQELMNYYAMRVIDTYSSEESESGKWIALIGSSHVNTFKGVPGVAELTGGIGVYIKQDEITQLQPGWSDIQRNHNRLITLQPDAVLGVDLASDLSAQLE